LFLTVREKYKLRASDSKDDVEENYILRSIIFVRRDGCGMYHITGI
jgi:hypothetical protein